MIRKRPYISLIMLTILTIFLGNISISFDTEHKISKIDTETVIRVLNSIYDCINTLDESSI